MGNAEMKATDLNDSVYVVAKQKVLLGKQLHLINYTSNQAHQ